MYLLYKLVQVLLYPGAWVAAGLVSAIVLIKPPRGRTPHPGLARGLLVATLLVFLASTTRPGADALLRPLEDPYPAVDATKVPKQDAIVVLAGGAHWEPGTHTPTVLDTASLDRMVEGIVLWRAGVAPMLVFTGGVGDPLRATPPESAAMKDLAIALGVPASAIVTDDASRTTAESAAQIARSYPTTKKIALVSTAAHLARGEQLFRAKGFTVTPVPAGHLAPDDGWSINAFVPGGTSLRHTESALHEDVGLLWARLRGQTR